MPPKRPTAGKSRLESSPSASLRAGKVWKTTLSDSATVSALSDKLKLPLSLSTALVVRGYTTADQAEHYLNPRLSDLSDPAVLPDMTKAVERIWKAIKSGEEIVIYGDYDVDGITSTALLTKVFGRLGARVRPFLPHRMDEGYGLSLEALQRCVESSKPGLLITVDCGTTAVDVVKAAKREGIDIIITDHHTPAGDVAPAWAVVNPKLGTDEPARLLAGVGVAFKLCHALLKFGRDQGSAVADMDLRSHLDLVALGTISDIVPLQGENRILARHGLDQLNRTASLGLQTLIRIAGITRTIDAYDVGFRLGPRLNAAGRLGDALNSLELLLTDDPEQAHKLATHLDHANKERQDIEARILAEAIELLDAGFDETSHFGLVAARLGWHPGVIGIVASRLVARYNRPVVVIALDGEGSGRGSCRGIEGFDLVDGLGLCSDLLQKFGGHTMAAGLEIEEALLGKFTAKFNEVAASSLSTRDLRPVQKVDAWMNLGDADERMFQALEKMRPFGFGNTTPVWAVAGARVVGQPRVVGQGHLKLLLASGGVQREAIGFGLGERLLPDGPLDVAFHLRKDSYQGRESLVLNLQDFRPSEPR